MTSPTQLLQSIRVHRAAERLAFSSDPVIEIAAECGYQSLSHFYRVFARHTGVTPLEYRRSGELGTAIPIVEA